MIGGRRMLAASLRSARVTARPFARPLAGRRWFSEAAAEGTEAKKPASPEVVALVDQIVQLNLMQVSELVGELNERLDLPEMPAGGMMMPMGGMPMGGAAGEAPAAEEAKEEEIKAIVNIQLDSFDAASKIKIIKEVKGLAGLGLKEAKAAVEGAPTVIMSDIKREEAEGIIKTLEELGGKASMI